jgi:hypothetical protein
MSISETTAAEREERRTVVRNAQHCSLFDIYNAVEAHVLARLAAKALPAILKLRPWLRHTDACNGWRDGTACDCGLDAALEGK